MTDTVVPRLNTSEFVTAVTSLAESLDRVLQAINRSVHVGHRLPQFLGVIVSDDPAVGAGDIRACLQPSDPLLKLVAALEAFEREIAGSEEFGHDAVPPRLALVAEELTESDREA